MIKWKFFTIALLFSSIFFVRAATNVSLIDHRALLPLIVRN